MGEDLPSAKAEKLERMRCIRNRKSSVCHEHSEELGDRGGISGTRTFSPHRMAVKALVVFALFVIYFRKL